MRIIDDSLYPALKKEGVREEDKYNNCR